MFVMFIYGFALGVVAIAITNTINYTFSNRNVHIESLKNALLTFALQIGAKDDIEYNNMNYDVFNGNTLPSMSGCDLLNACMSYIIDRSEFRRDPWYTKNMDQKSIAIEKYLAKKFATSNDTDAFFLKFIHEIKNL